MTYSVAGHDPGAWAQIFGPVGIQAGSPKRAEILILEGDSETARSFGFQPTSLQVQVRSVEEVRSPQVQIVWEHAAEVPVFEIPPDARVFTCERWTRSPLVAGFRREAGAVLWVAVSPGEQGRERFPYLLEALSDLGVRPPFRSNRLWAFFDSSYRSRADPDYLAERWRLAGIRGLHVAAWHFQEPDKEKDQYLRELIESCHRHGIAVYAWLELPHVSEQFWADHPEWREKTALLQDAKLDWRKLMNLANPECSKAAAAAVLDLIQRFDWDGVNLAELYFESLQGHENPSRFTPLNGDIRRLFQVRHGLDPLELFDVSSARHYTRNQTGLRQFLEFRTDLSRGIQAQWLGYLESARRWKPDLDIVLTHVDDRLDPRMRDAIGADASAVLPLLDRHRFTFLIEDPATVWNLGPERYRDVARQYGVLTRHQDRLAIDLNIVERYQDVYPTKQQVGTELFQVVSEASHAFPRVALYFEHAIQPPDVPWLASAAAVADCFESVDGKLMVTSPFGVGIRWEGTAQVDGRIWPAQDGETVWIPAGRHSVEPATGEPALRLLDFNGELLSATGLAGGIEFVYRSHSRAFVILDKLPAQVRIDGVLATPPLLNSASRVTLALPAGEHVVRVETR